MKTVGIIAEYNPYHNGHKYHMDKAMEVSNAENCIVAMSGNFVQRGEPASADKFLRAEWAVKSGADMVFEIPVFDVLSNAETYAISGLNTLYSTGIVTHLAFGCETEKPDDLFKIAEILSKETSGFSVFIKNKLKQGLSYPRAQYEALRDYGLDESQLNLLRTPNNILAVEYLKAINQYDLDITPVPIVRSGSNYNDEIITSENPSATAVRKAAKERKISEIKSVLPDYVFDIFESNPLLPVSDSDFSDIILYALRTSYAEELLKIPDVIEGVENLILNAVQNVLTYDDLLSEIKSKRYTMSRLKRIMMNILLKRYQYYTRYSPYDFNKSHLHLLAMKQSRKDLLSEIARSNKDTLIVRNADVEKCDENTRNMFYMDAMAADIYSIVCPYKVRRDCLGTLML